MNALQRVLEDVRNYVRKVHRRDDGRWDILDLPLAEPHEFDGDVYSIERCRQIHETTVREVPEGKCVVGHERPGEPEQLVVGGLGNHRFSKAGRHYADAQAIEPGVVLDIALGRLTGYSIEYRWPKLDAIEGLAFLGRSNPFFPFAKIKLKLTEDQLAQLRRDAESFPASAYTRAKLTDVDGRRFRVAKPKESTVKKQFRQVMKNGALTPEVREQNDKGEWGDWRAMREGEEMESDTASELSAIREAVDEIAARQQSLEDRVKRMEGDGGESDDNDDEREDDEDKKDDDKDAEGDRNKKRSPKADRAVLKKIDDLEKSQRELQRGLDEERVHSQLDAKVAKGAVIDASTRQSIVEAVMAKPKVDRQKTLDALTKNLRQVDVSSRSDEDDGLKDLDQDVGDDKELRQFITKDCSTKYRHKAREFAREFDELAKSEPHSPAVKGGKTMYVRAAVRALEQIGV